MKQLILDIQTAYANDIKKVEFEETVLDFDNPEDLYVLHFFKNFQIFPHNDILKFSGDLIKIKFKEEDLNKMQRNNNKNLCKSFLAKKLIQENKDILSNLVAQNLSKIFEFSKRSEDTISEENLSTEIKTISNLIKSYFKNIKILNYTNECIFVTELTSVCFSSKDLNFLYELCKTFNLKFKILAKYNYNDEQDEKCYGIKFLFNYEKK